MIEFFLAIFLMLASAWILGEALHRVGQPAIVGQLLAGVLIGPSVLNLVQVTTALSTVESVGLFFIMLLAGLAVNPSKLIASGKRGIIVSTVAFVLPFTFGFEVAQLFGISLVSSLTIGLVVSITAVPVNALILMQLGIFDTQLGTTVIVAGVVDDIISFVMLSFIQQFAGVGVTSPGAGGIILSVIKVAIFLGAVLICEQFIRAKRVTVHRWTERLSTQLKAQGSFIAILLIFAVGVSLLAEWSGVQLVIGAFFAGVLASELAGADALGKATDIVRGATFGFFGPVAFAFIGTEFVLTSIYGILFLLVSLLAVAIVGKLLGGYLGGKIVGFSTSDSATIGFLMNSRGFVELVISATAYQLGLIDQSVFSLVIAIGIITTIVSPITSKYSLRGKTSGDHSVVPKVQQE
jgi:Kef-type K+ transport system membrane component KefB